MTTDAAILPLRTLGPQQKAAIHHFYGASSGVGLFLAAYLPVVLCLCIGGTFIGFLNGLIAGIAISAFCLLLRRWKIRRNTARAEYIYQYGEEEELTFRDISNNYGLKVNGAPQQVISLLRNGRPMQIKTFKPSIVAVYSVPRQIAYTHPKYPDVIVPSALFGLAQPAPARSPGRVLRRALVFMLPFAFVIGLTYFISGEMSSHSDTYSQPDALIYQQDGRLVLASVITQFKAYEVSNKGTYGDDYCYAEGLDLLTGKRLWKIPFHAKDNQGRDFGGARLLGQSGKYLFFLRNELYVVDKASGKVVAQNETFGPIKDQMSKAMIASYDEDAAYTYNDSMQAVVVKGTDGLFYTIDGLTLKTGTTDIADPDTYFKNSFKYGNNYEDQIAAVYDDGTRCLALLDTKDTVLLAHNPYGVRERPAEESIRRVLYSCPSNSLSDGWATLNQGVFLFGGFLVNAAGHYRQPKDTLAKYASYQSLAARYNHSNPPLRTGNGGFLIMHKTSIEPTATLLLTAISGTGATLWQVATGYAAIPLMYQDVAGDRLYLAGNAKGAFSDRLTEMSCIDLKTGKVNKYVMR